MQGDADVAPTQVDGGISTTTIVGISGGVTAAAITTSGATNTIPDAAEVAISGTVMTSAAMVSSTIEVFQTILVGGDNPEGGDNLLMPATVAGGSIVLERQLSGNLVRPSTQVSGLVQVGEDDLFAPSPIPDKTWAEVIMTAYLLSTWDDPVRFGNGLGDVNTPAAGGGDGGDVDGGTP